MAKDGNRNAQKLPNPSARKSHNNSIHPHCLTVRSCSTVPQKQVSQPLPHLPSTSPALSLAIRHRLPITRNTLPVANRSIHIIERQIPLLGTIPPFDRRTPARLTLVLQHLVRQRPDLRQRQIRAGLQIIRERAHAPVADADVELVVPAGAVAVGAAGHVGADTEAFGGADADYVLAFRVGGVEGFGRGVDCVAEDLDDGFGVFVFEFGEGAEAGATAVEAEGGDGGAGCGDGDDEEGEEGCEGCGGMHGDVMKNGN